MEPVEPASKIGPIDFPSMGGNSAAKAGGADIDSKIFASRFPIGFLLASFPAAKKVRQP